MSSKLYQAVAIRNAAAGFMTAAAKEAARKFVETAAEAGNTVTLSEIREHLATLFPEFDQDKDKAYRAVRNWWNATKAKLLKEEAEAEAKAAAEKPAETPAA